MVSLPFILALMSCAFTYEILYAFNCGSENTIHAPLITYTSDQMYEGLKSKSLKKKYLPQYYVDPFDMELLQYQRTTDGNEFSYFLKLTGADRYYLLLKFVEVVYQNPGKRVFDVKLGDDVVATIDLIGQITKGVVVNKWIEFDLYNDVLYINKSIPVLNGYIYPKQTMKLTLSKVVGQPKIEALILLKGHDAGRFYKQYEQLERKRILGKREQLTCQKYQRQQKLPYKPIMVEQQHFRYHKNKFEYYLDQLLSFSTFSAIVAVVFVMIYEKIFKSLNGSKEDDTKEQ